MINLENISDGVPETEPLRLFACCPCCGNKLGQSADGTDTVTHCNVCGNIVEYKVKENVVALKVEPRDRKSKKKKLTGKIDGNIAS